MRILGFSKHFDKLSFDTFTTFRFPRKDRDWYEGERVQIVYKPRSKDREVLGIAKIISFRIKQISSITEHQARVDGFEDWIDMVNWLRETYGKKLICQDPSMNKLTLRWIYE